VSETWNVESVKAYVDSNRASDQTAVQAALAAQEKAIIKAEAAAERRFELLNELRQGVATKEQLEALEKVVQVLNDRMNLKDGASRGITAGWGYLVGTLGISATIVTVILAFNN
jgi:hypothetical protein